VTSERFDLAAPAAGPHEPLRTFHPRRATLGRDRAAALDRLWPTLGLTVHEPASWPRTGDGLLDTPALFGRSAPLVLEIGPGMGAATVLAAAADPDRDVLAVEVHLAGVAALLLGVERAGLTNVRVGFGDALHLLRTGLAAEQLDELRAYFPDPWPKARHHKRRLLGQSHAPLLVSRLRVGGILHAATDWAPYAAQIRAVLGAVDGLEALDEDRAGRPVTAFERKALAAGRPATDLRYRRVRALSGPPPAGAGSTRADR
jgi:tRNA (guanine-N7-)-methyltransferase